MCKTWSWRCRALARMYEDVGAGVWTSSDSMSFVMPTVSAIGLRLGHILDHVRRLPGLGYPDDQAVGKASLLR